MGWWLLLFLFLINWIWPDLMRDTEMSVTVCKKTIIRDDIGDRYQKTWHEEKKRKW